MQSLFSYMYMNYIDDLYRGHDSFHDVFLTIVVLDLAITAKINILYSYISKYVDLTVYSYLRSFTIPTLYAYNLSRFVNSTSGLCFIELPCDGFKMAGPLWCGIHTTDTKQLADE